VADIVFFKAENSYALFKYLPYLTTFSQISHKLYVGLESVVGIATCYGLDGSGFETLVAVTFSIPVRTGPLPYPTYTTIGIASFLGVKRRKHGLNNHPV
jgi:hypothetical protein